MVVLKWGQEQNRTWRACAEEKEAHGPKVESEGFKKGVIYRLSTHPSSTQEILVIPRPPQSLSEPSSPWS
jgi:hypothetical protein